MQLVPQFMETITTILRKEQLSQAPINFTNPSEGPTVMDDHSLAIKVIIKGVEVPEAIIDGELGANVISKRTNDTIGIWEWDPCPFWLRMADTNSVVRDNTGRICIYNCRYTMS